MKDHGKLQQLKPRTPKEEAIEFIRPYVMRGDPDIGKTFMGFGGGRITVQIGGYLYDPQTKKLVHLKPGIIGSSNRDELQLFKVSDLADEIRNGPARKAMRDEALAIVRMIGK